MSEKQIVRIILDGGAIDTVVSPDNITIQIVDLDTWEFERRCPICEEDWVYEGAPGETCPQCGFDPQLPRKIT